MKKFSIKKLFDNNRFVQVFALFAAALCWLIVAMTQSYTTTEIIRNVPVRVDTQSGSLENLGLHAIEAGGNLVDIEVEGLRSVVGQLKPEDFNIVARPTGVTEAGSFDLTLVSSTQTPSPDYEIKRFYPPTVKVKFDRVEKRFFNIGGEINGIAIAPGYAEKTTFIAPDVLSVEGPLSSIEKISRCAITAEITDPLDKTYQASFPIILYDANGMVLDPEALHLTLSEEEAQLVIQILKVTNLPLAVEYINVPRGFPIDALTMRTKISPSDITLAGPADLIDNLVEIKLDYIDLKSVNLSSTVFSYEVPLPSPSEQFMQLDNVTNVSVNIDDTGLDTATFNISEIRIINAPPDFEVTPLATSISGVEFVGAEDILASMTASDIVAEIDLADREISTGSYPFPVKISVPGKGLVWAVGNYSVTIKVTDTRAAAE